MKSIQLADLEVLIDLTTHLNKLDMRLQGKNKMINKVFQSETEIIAIDN